MKMSSLNASEVHNVDSSSSNLRQDEHSATTNEGKSSEHDADTSLETLDYFSPTVLEQQKDGDETLKENQHNADKSLEIFEQFSPAVLEKQKDGDETFEENQHDADTSLEILEHFSPAILEDQKDSNETSNKNRQNAISSVPSKYMSLSFLTNKNKRCEILDCTMAPVPHDRHSKIR